jgi:hypothetical protein
MGKSEKVPTGMRTRKDRVALLKDNPLLPTPEEIRALDREIMRECTVANKHARLLTQEMADGDEKSIGQLSSHSKMKLQQDFFVTAFMHPVMRRRFLEKCYEDPVALAKLSAAMMPKELNVEINQNQGVILVPMRMENVDEWEKKAIASLSDGDTIEGESLPPRVDDWDDLINKG